MMNQPMMFNRSGRGWVAQPTERAKKAEVARMVERLEEGDWAEEVARTAKHARECEARAIDQRRSAVRAEKLAGMSERLAQRSWPEKRQRTERRRKPTGHSNR